MKLPEVKFLRIASAAGKFERLDWHYMYANKQSPPVIVAYEERLVISVL